MRVLQLTYRVPYPPTDGGAMGIYTITKGLAENGCAIDLVAINTPKHSQPKDAMKNWARQFDVFVDTKIRLFRFLKNFFFEELPYNIVRFQSSDVDACLINLLNSTTYDFIQVEGAFVSTYLPLIKAHSVCPVIVRTHNIEYIIWKRLAVNERNPLKKWFYQHLSKRLYTFESTFYNFADGIAAITNEDKERLIKMGVLRPIEVIPVGTEFEKFSNSISSQIENSIFMIGALDWLPNVEGLNWFMQNVWSALHNKYPTLELHIAGKGTPEHIKNWQHTNVKVHGFVDDAVSFMNSYQIMLVPLLSGGGMRVKIIEGLAAGKCIVSTTIGAEGVQAENNQHIAIADTPDEWINAISKLIEQPADIERIQKNARQLAVEKYENRAVTSHYISFSKKLIQFQAQE